MGLPLRPVSLLTCSLTPFLLFVSSLFWSLFLLSERLSLQPHLVSNRSPPVSLSLILSPPFVQDFPFSLSVSVPDLFPPRTFRVSLPQVSISFSAPLSPSPSSSSSFSLSVPPTLFPPLPQIPLLSSFPLRFSFLPAGRPASRPRCGLPFQSRLTPPLLASPPTSKPDPWFSCPHRPGEGRGGGCLLGPCWTGILV